MKRFLSRGIRKAKKVAPPDEGYTRTLIYETLPNGYHYQVEYFYDRYPCNNGYATKSVMVYCFRPPKSQLVRPADFYLKGSI